MPGECPKRNDISQHLAKYLAKCVGIFECKSLCGDDGAENVGGQHLLKNHHTVHSASRYVCRACPGLCMGSAAPVSTHLGRDVESLEVHRDSGADDDHDNHLSKNCQNGLSFSNNLH